MSRTDKRVVVVLAVGLLALGQVGLAGAAFFVRRQTTERLEDERMRVESCQHELQRVASQSVTTPPTARRWSRLDEPDVAGTMQMLTALGDTSRIVFDRVKASPSNAAGKQAFQVTGRGSPRNVCEFLAAVEQAERLIVIESGRILPGGDEQVAFEFGLATYHAGGVR